MAKIVAVLTDERNALWPGLSKHWEYLHHHKGLFLRNHDLLKYRTDSNIFNIPKNAHIPWNTYINYDNNILFPCICAFFGNIKDKITVRKMHEMEELQDNWCSTSKIYRTVIFKIDILGSLWFNIDWQSPLSSLIPSQKLIFFKAKVNMWILNAN